MTELLTRSERFTESATTTNNSILDRDRKPGGQRPWYAATLCAIGIHTGRWIYLIDGKCGQVKVCGRCGKTKVRTKHQHEWQYIKNGDCEQDRVCQRCGEKSGHRTRHTWGETYSVSWTKDGHKCNRCGETEEWTPAG